MAYFHLRLAGPRPTFPFDMNGQEQEAMGRHMAYWREQAENRIAIAVGPVMAADGPFGMAVVEVADETAARDLADADPVIRAGLGFRFDIAPIPSIILRQA